MNPTGIGPLYTCSHMFLVAGPSLASRPLSFNLLMDLLCMGLLPHPQPCRHPGPLMPVCPVQGPLLVHHQRCPLQAIYWVSTTPVPHLWFQCKPQACLR